jgi:hypothetical protein
MRRAGTPPGQLGAPRMHLENHAALRVEANLVPDHELFATVRLPTHQTQRDHDVLVDDLALAPVDGDDDPDRIHHERRLVPGGRNFDALRSVGRDAQGR